MKFVFSLKSRLIFKRFCCFCMFVNKHLINAGTCNSECKTFGILFLYENKDIVRRSYDKVNSEPNETIAKKVKLCCKIINA